MIETVFFTILATLLIILLAVNIFVLFHLSSKIKDFANVLISMNRDIKERHDSIANSNLIIDKAIEVLNNYLPEGKRIGFVK